MGMMKQNLFVRSFLLAMGMAVAVPVQAQKKTIYHKDWIDFNKNGVKDVYEDPAQPVEKRVEDLLSQMTVEEKTCQLATLYGYGRVLRDSLPVDGWKEEIWKDGIANIDEMLNGVGGRSVRVEELLYPFSNHAEAINKVQRWFVEETRLGIPVDFSNEGIHGLNHTKATPLPAPIGVGSTWNRDLVRRAGEIVGREARALGYTNVYAPILDVVRDPRWGRTLECYGEDPYLIAELGIEMVEGIQSQGVASTLKHYAVYSVPKGGRDGDCRTDPHVAPRELHQLYLYPFRRVIQEAHPLGVMSSYNDWDGVPVTASPYFMTELLRGEYGFDGYTVIPKSNVDSLYHVGIDFERPILIEHRADMKERDSHAYEYLEDVPVTCGNYVSMEVPFRDFSNVYLYDWRTGKMMQNSFENLHNAVYYPIGSYRNSFVTYLADYSLYEELVANGFEKAPQSVMEELKKEGSMLIFYEMKE